MKRILPILVVLLGIFIILYSLSRMTVPDVKTQNQPTSNQLQNYVDTITWPVEEGKDKG